MLYSLSVSSHQGQLFHFQFDVLLQPSPIIHLDRGVILVLQAIHQNTLADLENVGILDNMLIPRTEPRGEVRVEGPH